VRLLGLKTFRHGIHPPEAKDETRGLAIRRFPFAPVLVVPLVQHLGKPSLPVVREGEEVARGQRIAEPDGFMSVSMHAPATGVVRRIALTPSISGRMVPGVYLEPHPASTQEVVEGTPCPPDAAPSEIIAAIQDAGVVGLGGAAFPTHVKLSIPEGRTCDTLILNGAECDPYLTTDHRVMLEQRDDVFMGLRYLLRVTGAERAVIAVEANKPDAAEHLRKGLPEDLPVSVEVLRVKYPQGAEKVLITALLGREVPSGGLPLDARALCINVATAAEIGRLLPHGRGIQERVVTVTGPAVRHKGNYRIPIGTPLRFLLEQVGVSEDVNRVFLGGPMMGAAASSLDIPLTKGILNPQQLGVLARNEEHERMAEEHHLMDCFECGSCSFVCPSHIPLVQQFRMAKAALRKARSAPTRSTQSGTGLGAA
jgi:electron transport complex protein RnfC